VIEHLEHLKRAYMFLSRGSEILVAGAILFSVTPGSSSRCAPYAQESTWTTRE